MEELEWDPIPPGFKCETFPKQIVELYKSDDPLTKAVRIRLISLGVKKGVQMLFSNEETDRKLLDLNEVQE